MKKIFSLNKGYTLIELLAVMIILVSAGVVVTSIMVSTLRGGNKSTTTNDVRQNGQYAISQMSKMITFAKEFNGVSVDNVTYSTNCLPYTGPTPIPTPPLYQYIKITSFDGGTTTFSCSSNTISSNSASLLNQNIAVSNCFFTCTQASLSVSPTIKINFTLSKLNSGFFAENQTTIPFDTSITLRNN